MQAKHIHCTVSVKELWHLGIWTMKLEKIKRCCQGCLPPAPPGCFRQLCYVMLLTQVFLFFLTIDHVSQQGHQGLIGKNVWCTLARSSSQWLFVHRQLTLFFENLLCYQSMSHPLSVSSPFCIYLFCANRGYGSETSHMLHFSHCFPLRALVCLWSVAEKKLHITKRVTTRLRISMMSKESIGIGTAWEQCVPDELPDVFLVKKCGAVKKCVGLCVF